MDSIVEELLDDVARIGPGWLHVVAFLLALGETAFLTDLLVPGEVGLVVVGAAAARADAPLPTMILLAALGATVGDSVGWVLGRYFGVELLERFGWTRRRVLPTVERTRVYFDRRGGAAVFFGRFVGALRSVVSVVAGASRMPYRRFLVWNVAASFAWTGLVIAAGYYFGRNVKGVVGEVSLIVAVAILGTAIAVWLVRRRRVDRR